MRMVGLGVQAITLLLAARWSGLANFGSLSFTLAVATIGMIPAAALADLVLRTVSAGDRQLSVLVMWGTRIIVLSAPVAAGLAYAWLHFLPGSNRATFAAAEAIACTLYCGALGLTQFLQAVLRVYWNPLLAAIADGVLRPIVALVIILAGATSRLGLHLAYAASAVAALLVMLTQSRRAGLRWDGLLRSANGGVDPQWRRSTAWFGLSHSAFAITTRGPVIVLGVISGTVAVAELAIAQRFTEIAVTVLLVASFASSPRLANLVAERRLREAERYSRRVGAWAAGGAIGLLTAESLVLRPLLRLLGTDTSTTRIMFLALAVGTIVDASAGQTNLMPTLFELERRASRVHLTVAVFVIAATATLVTFTNASGAAIAIALGSILSNLLILRLVRKSIGITASPLVPILTMARG
jgi:O-antigen/teichoic acid export membrane protein